MEKWGKKRNEKKREKMNCNKKGRKEQGNTTSVSNRNLAQSQHPPLTTHTVSWKPPWFYVTVSSVSVPPGPLQSPLGKLVIAGSNGFRARSRRGQVGSPAGIEDAQPSAVRISSLVLRQFRCSPCSLVLSLLETSASRPRYLQVNPHRPSQV